jgi:hypothetical protein
VATNNGSVAGEYVNEKPSREKEFRASISGVASDLERSSHLKNVGSTERLVSAVVGAILLFIVRRKLLFYLSMGGFGAYLLYRGISGNCLIYESMGVDTSQGMAGRGYADLFVRTGSASDGGSSHAHEREPGVTEQRNEEDESDTGLEQALKGSFPASDPPANW